MGSWSRPVGVVTALTMIGALAACGEPAPPPLGPAAKKVTVIRGDRTYPTTAEVTGWQVRTHPQVPDRGNAVHFTYQFAGFAPERIELQICAVDAQRVVLLCSDIGHADSGDIVTPRWLEDGWIGPSEGIDLSRTAEVVLVPNQMFPGLHAGDPKDHDGYVPPRGLAPGDRI
ncbi:hypothetical protein LX15_000131 [Streptoalloteichus tenebrarius]|uniref:Lipoprotein n=1 Tax=Streptoalloteichus tenebrarius (strain ATCC 17920 / DSM 40477 / JCM 4838 / CBS 697.72 / NBRC 16177 / NCIMB 11028 / NRRL B-12390 / A12253. 1 / ISP 5477) TaxID=1933 RepID=A0ABT1HLR1_STRSD|nr:hypothetical protein [Streptoalloteichus tenebrarius]MCP2256448.1 hypothetical protein [Streptoalloteichus tenebrarius]BFF04799.1 hypothetical protein GCM10020241_64740 [Streptoalloteichus tenebrarius]